MEHSETRARLAALPHAVGRTLEDSRTLVRNASRSEFASVQGDLPSRDTPISGGTMDHDGRGCIIRQTVEELDGGMRNVLDASASTEKDGRSDGKSPAPSNNLQ